MILCIVMLYVYIKRSKKVEMNLEKYLMIGYSEALSVILLQKNVIFLKIRSYTNKISWKIMISQKYS